MKDEDHFRPLIEARKKQKPNAVRPAPGRSQVQENALRLPDLCFGIGIGVAVGIGIGFDPAADTDSDPDRSDMGGIFGIEGAAVAESVPG